MKGWQVSYPVPGSDDEMKLWFDYSNPAAFVEWLDNDRKRFPELDCRVDWVGFP